MLPTGQTQGSGPLEADDESSAMALAHKSRKPVLVTGMTSQTSLMWAQPDGTRRRRQTGRRGTAQREVDGRLDTLDHAGHGAADRAPTIAEMEGTLFGLGMFLCSGFSCLMLCAVVAALAAWPRGESKGW